MNELPVQVLNELLLYVPWTGEFLWKRRDLRWFANQRSCNSWNAQHAGRHAFTAEDEEGYKYACISVGGKRRNYRANRVAWAMFYGEWPEEMVDHIDHDLGNNRIANLREATDSQNQQNKVTGHGTSTFKGVHFCQQTGRWRATIKTAEGWRHIGRFSSEIDAARAYDESAKRHFGAFACVNF